MHRYQRNGGFQKCNFPGRGRIRVHFVSRRSDPLINDPHRCRRNFYRVLGRF